MIRDLYHKLSLCTMALDAKRATKAQLAFAVKKGESIHSRAWSAEHGGPPPSGTSREHSRDN